MNQEERTKKVFRIIYTCILSVVLVFFCIVGIFKLIPIVSGPISKQLGIDSDKETPTESRGSSSFTFMGVGDNIVYEPVYFWEQAEGRPFEFSGIYSYMEPYAQGHDIAYISGETICAGERFGYASYPTFNGPTEILNAIYGAGFNWMSVCSEHTYDVGSEGLDTELTYLEQFPELTYTGSHLTKEDSECAKVIVVNDIRVGVQSYTYNANFSLNEDESWKINIADKIQMEDDIENLKTVSDVQIVSMHWGTEFDTDITSEQRDLAEYLNELGVDVIIGSHPHLIQPAEIIQGDEGDTLCYYSLGNFLSCQDNSMYMIGGMASFTLNYDFDTKKVSWENVKFTPTITYFDAMYRNIKTVTIHEYNETLASTHCYIGTTVDFVKEFVTEIFEGTEGIEVDLG